MNKKTVFLLSVATLSMFGGYLASADTVVATSQTIQSNGESNLVGNLTITQDNNGIVAILTDIKTDLTTISAKLWSNSSPMLTQSVVFEKDSQGRYVAQLDRSGFEASIVNFQLAVQAESADGHSHTFNSYSFVWQTEQEQVNIGEQESSISQKADTNDELKGSVSTKIAKETLSDTASSYSKSETEKTLEQPTDLNTDLAASKPESLSNLSNKANQLSRVKKTAFYKSTITPRSIRDIATNSNATLESEKAVALSNARSAAIVDNSLKRNPNLGIGLGSAAISRTSGIEGTTGQLQIENINPTAGTFDVLVKNVVHNKPLDKIYLPTWTEAGGQDDLVWHVAQRQGDGSYKFTVNKAQHKNGTGKYHVHLYYVGTDKSLKFVSGTTAELPAPQSTTIQGTLHIENINATTGTFDVLVKNVVHNKPLDKIYLPTWTEAGGQDDLVWHVAQRQGDGSYKFTVNKAQHKNGTGKYHVHLYYVGTDKSLKFVSGTTAELPAPQSTTIQGTLHIENINATTGTFDVLVKNVVHDKPLEKIYLPTWTEAGGQDDIVWHEAQRQGDGSYKFTVNKAQHKNGTGKYTIHMYYRSTDGTMTYVSSTSTTLPDVPTSGRLSIEKVNGSTGSFDVVVRDVSYGKALDRVYLPTWTEAGGQDDIVWHEAQRQGDGSYKFTVNKAHHKNGTGKYTIHMYYRSTDGTMTYVSSTSTTLPDVPTSGRLSIEKVNGSTGSFDVVVRDVSYDKALDRVYLPTWTEAGGQDDIVWHEAQRQGDGSYKFTVNKAHHKNGTGKYHVHLYYVGTDKSLKYVSGITAELPASQSTTIQGTLHIENINATTGTFDVLVKNIAHNKPLDKIYLPTWTEAGGQDDIVWHEAQHRGDGSYKFTVNKAQHKNGTGKYTIHMYYRSTDGTMTYVSSTSTTLPDVPTSGRLSIEKVNGSTGSFDVVVRDVSYGKALDRVYLPTWTEAGGQDDIVWHEAQRQGDGSYKFTVNKAQHKNGTGKYHVHLYYVGTDKSLQYVSATTAELPNSQRTTERSKTIFIDPGHGGRDSGAFYGGIKEKDLALSVSNKLRDNLIKNGYNVIMSRTHDQDVDFRTERSRLVNQSNADIFISIHFNATGKGVSQASGIETYWYQYDSAYQPKINKAMHNDPTRLAESEILANKVQSNLIRETGAVNRGVRRETFAVLRETAKPAILVELGFMDNPSELQVIKQESYHNKLANALTRGIIDWYGTVGGKVASQEHPFTSLTNQQNNFVQTIKSDVLTISKDKSLLPSVMMAQAILESGWGSSQLASAPNYNLFGIKADPSWQGEKVKIVTKEFVGNRFVEQEKYFRAYPNWKESLKDYSKFFTSTNWRKNNYAAFLSSTDYRTALEALQRSGYATDPNYSSKLKTIIEKYGLSQYDRLQ